MFSPNKYVRSHQMYCSKECWKKVYSQSLERKEAQRLRSVSNRQINKTYAKERYENTRKQYINGTYILRAVGTDLYKIGYTKHIYGRMIVYATHSPLPIELLFIIEDNIEKELHNRFAGYLDHGEWFKLSETQVDQVIMQYVIKATANLQ